MYLLDSDILVFLRRGKYHIQERVIQCGLANCVVSEISLAELYVGVYKSGDPVVRAMVEKLEALFIVLPISGVLKEFVRLRAQLEIKGAVLDKMDLFIAATALVNDCTLVTHNTRHFARIPGLRLEDWVEE